MSPIPRSTNHLLQSLPAAEFEALRPHLGFVELVRQTVLVEAGAPLTHVYLPQSGILSMVVRLSEGRSVERWSAATAFSAPRPRSTVGYH
jgi:hypothetical protein